MSVSKRRGPDFLGKYDLRKNIHLNIFPGFSNSVIPPTPNKTFCYQMLPLL